MARALIVGERGEVRGSDGRLRRAQWGDVALLLPRLTILEPYEAALRRHDVPYRTEAGRAYYRRDETHALAQILRALADPGDSVAVVAALRGPGFGCSDHDLTAYALAVPRPRFDLAGRPGDPASSPDPEAAARTAAALERLRALRAEIRGWPLPELVQAAIDRLGLQAFYRVQWRGQQRLANLDKAVELARRFEELGQPSLQGFVRWLAARGEGEFDEGDAPAIERSQDAIRVLTVHKAKGLEFPIVLFGGLVGRGKTASNTDRLQVARQRGDEEPGRLEAKVSKGSTRGFEAATKSEEERASAERKRLLYVAVTRARDLLVLPWLPGSSNVVDLYKLLYEQAGADWEGSPLAHRWHARDLPPGEAPEVEPPLVELVLADPAAAPPPPVLSLPRPAAELPAVARGAIARAERRGRAVHALLAAALTGSPAPDLLGLDEAERLAARESARRFLASPLGRRASAADQRLVETPLAVAVEGGVRDLRLDLAFREPAGWVLVDYKNDREGARSTAERTAELRAQLAGYAGMLEQLTAVPVSEAHLAFLITGETRRYGRPELVREPA
jgi:ATP-dependent exoDNAse (exonuclease V) beta subunit